MRKFIFPLLLLILFFIGGLKVHALTESGDYESGDSVKGNFKIGSHNIGANDFYSIPVNGQDNSKLSGGFTALSDLYIDSNDPYNYIGQTWVYFAVDFCRTINGYLELPYRDYGTLDYTVNLNSSLYLSNDWWNNAHCWRSYVHFRMNYRLDTPLPDTKRIYFYNTDYNYFRYYNTDSAANNLRYIDLIYLSSDDYYKLINESKNNSNISSINDKLNGVQDKIDGVGDKVDDVKDSVDDVNDTLNNSDTTQANSTGSSWFNGFHVDNTKGFSSIITAPIRLIQGILNGSSSCSPLTFDISLKHNSTTQSNEVSLPCGSILWNNVPNAAVLLYWSTIFGLFAWWVLRDMYKFIDSIRDPDSKTEFVMQL